MTETTEKENPTPESESPPEQPEEEAPTAAGGGPAEIQVVKYENPPDERVREVLTMCRSVAVVGLTPDQKAPANRVARFLKRHGFRIFPINPRYASVLGELARPYLRNVDQPVEIVQVFRRPEHLGGVLEDAVQVGATVIWFQLGIAPHELARRAKEMGFEVVLDRCMKREYERLILKRNIGKKYVP